MKYIDIEELYSQPPPPFGHKLRPFFMYDPSYVALNSGSYGPTPVPVQQAAHEVLDMIEANPDRFLKLTYQPLLAEARSKVANLIGANMDDVVLVTNASIGINTVLRNFEWEEGDTIIVSNTTYVSVLKTVQSLGDARPHPAISYFSINFPTTTSALLSSFHAHIQSLPKNNGKKRVAVIDAIYAFPSALLPWKDMVKICKKEGVYTVIDAAHAIGQELGINLSEADPDFWISNCHKWLYGKRSVAVLYVAQRNQHLIKTTIPTSNFYNPASLMLAPNFVEQFEWTGTIDYTPIVTIPDVFRFRAWLGGEEKINAYCRDLARRGGQKLAEVMGTSVLDPAGEFTLNMVNVELPFPGSIPFSPEIDYAFRKGMLEGQNAFGMHFYHNGKWWTRASAQVFNEVEDFEKLGKAWLVVCKDVLDAVVKNAKQGD